MPTNDDRADEADRQRHADATYERLFGPRDRTAPDNDPELTSILRGFILQGRLRHRHPR
jgi:4-carboxymuconolactone decarboxylase